MPSPASAQRARLDVSSRSTLLFIEDGYSLTVAQLCEQLGVPERTFYNYFPTKADAIRPVLENGIEQVATTLAREPVTRSFPEVMVEGFTRSLWGEDAANTRKILALVVSEPALYAVWLSTIRSFEATVAAAIAPRLSIPSDSLQGHMLAATLVAAVRISFEHVATHDSEPVATFREALATIDLSLLSD